MNHKIIYFIPFLILWSVLMGPLLLTANGAPFPQNPTVTVPTQGLPTDLGQLIQQIFTWSLGLLGIAVFVMFFYAGLLWLTAAGNTANVGEAKSRMTNAVFGAILLLSSYLILNTINPNFVQNTFNLKGLGTQSSQQGPGSDTQPPPYSGPQPPNILVDVVAERAKYGSTPTNAELGKMLNAIAWKNKDAGWGLSGKNFGEKCPSPAGEIACDILHHKPTNVLVDVFQNAGAESAPVWQVSGPPPGTNRPWVAPAQP